MERRPRLERVLLWRRLDQSGAEYCALSRDAAGWRLDGTVVAVLDGRPARTRYRVVCDEGWRTRAVGVELVLGTVERSLRLTVDDRGRWRQGSDELPLLRGCVDVDLGVSPATNTLPIRRLALPVGGSRDVVAAWVRFPDLQVEPLLQRYTRLGPDRYRYESLDSAFVAELDVDDLGLVRRYAGGWERVAVADPRREQDA